MADNNPNLQSMPCEYYVPLWQTAFMSRWQSYQIDTDEIERQSIERLAKTLLLNGFTLIPCEHLKDKQCVVSSKVYGEAVRLLQEDPNAEGQ